MEKGVRNCWNSMAVGGWEAVQELYYVYRHIPRRADVRCDDGRADEFDCGLVDLVSFLPNEEMGMNRGVLLSDLWGWTDPETGIEYGLIGHLEGTVFIDLSTPSNPRYLGTLPRTEGSSASIWRDIKVYKNHAFIVADMAQEHGMQIFDLTQLRGLVDTPVEFEATAHYSQIHSAHNIVINEETGFAFAVGVSEGGETCGGGLHMIDIREPQAPVFVGCFADETTGRRKTGYSHDAQCVIYNGPDSEYAGREICFGANETAISISDVTDKENPIAIGTGSYPGAAYVHQGWLTEDHSYFFQNDELDEQYDKVDKTRTLIWDVRDLSDPIMIREFYGPTSATDHNLYIRDNLMYQTNYKSGLRIIDVSSPENPVEIGYFDTTPYGANGAGYDGTLGSYPFFESGIIVVTSIREGVFILKKQSADI
ncbi:MAG: choice-of-anchor B family protein [Rhodothermaceae bacterium]|nr:choice-of-anchor B family protein [Rhodothermaceae bacterium]